MALPAGFTLDPPVKLPPGFTLDAPPGGVPPDAGAQMRASALARTGAAMDDTVAGGTIQLPTNPYGGAPVITAATSAPAGAPMADVANAVNQPGHGAIQMIHGAEEMSRPGLRAKVGGGTHIVQGGMKVLSPALLATGIAAPLETAADLAIGTGAGDVVEGGLKAAGVPDEYAEGAGTLASLAAPGAAHTEVGGRVLDRVNAGVDRVGARLVDTGRDALAAPVRALVPTQLDPAEAAAVKYGDAAGVQMPASVRTGSKLAGDAELLAQHTPFSAGIAKAGRTAEQTSLAAAGAREVADLGPGPAPSALEAGESIHAKMDANIAAHAAAGAGLVDSLKPGAAAPSPLDVGESVQKAASATEAAHSKQADDSYAIFRSIENQPQFKATVQTGTERVPDIDVTGRRILDEKGNPAFKTDGFDKNGMPAYQTVPVMEDVQLPVNYRALKAAVKPLLAETLKPMSITQEQSSRGIKALRNILDAPNYVSASTADQDLGALKGVLRESAQARSVGLVKFAADKLSKQVEDAATRAGPEAVAALKEGRAATVRKYDTQDFQKSLGFKNVGTGQVEAGSAVDLHSKLTSDSDRNIALLRSVQKITPEQIPGIAQSSAQALADRVKAGDAAGAADRFNAQGDQTKKILYPANSAAALGDYVQKGAALQAAKKALPNSDVLVSRVMQAGDKSANLLRSIAAHSPEHIPAIGQSVVQGLIDHGTAEAGMGKPQTVLRRWLDMGDVTKNVLFRDPYSFTDGGGPKIQNLTNFFTLMKKMGENPNPSGSGTVMGLMSTLGMVVLHPHIGIPALIGSRAITRMLFNPTESGLMLRALKIPAKSAGAGLLADQIIKAAGPDAVPLKGAAGAPASTQVVPATPISSAASAPIPAQSEGITNGQQTGQANQGTAAEGVHVPQTPATVSPIDSGGGRTSVRVPGKAGKGYPATYKLKELDDINASHNGLSFNANPEYKLANDRDYSNRVNQGTVVNGSTDADFDAARHITDNPDSTNGPVVTDSKGNVLGGNGRAMMLQRIYSANGKAAASYRQMLAAKAGQYGIDPADAAGMKNPVLTREVDNAKDFNAANAITDMNKTGTGALTPSERAIADSKRVSIDTLDHVAGQLENGGPKATISSILDGKPGTAILDKLVSDGVVSPQERAGLADSNGLTKDGKERVSRLLVGRFFESPDQIDRVPLSIRGKIERVAAPVAATEGLGAGWNLTPDLREAVGIIDKAKAAGVPNIQDFLKQDGMFSAAGMNYSARAVKLAQALSTSKSADILAAARQFAADAKYAGKGASLMGGEPTPQESFDASFGKLESGAAVEAKARVKKVKP